MRRRGALVLAASLATACASPEAARVRGGGPGADPGNRTAVVRMHAGAEPYYRTPCNDTLDRCTGPMPIFWAPRADSASPPE